MTASRNRTIKKTDLVWLPNRREEQLLKAGLKKDGAAVEAWLAYKSDVDLANAAEGEKRLFPLAYHNLRNLDFTDEFTGFLKSAHREAHRSTTFQMKQTADLCALLARHKIPTIVLKGAALAVFYYPSAALRPASDVDLMIKPENFNATVEILKNRNWRTSERNPASLVKLVHACQFVNEQGDELDLHWHLLRDCWNANKNEIFWENAVEIKNNFLETKILCATDQIFHICCHGAKYNSLSPVRWVADAVMIFERSGGEINWTRLLRLANFFRLSMYLYYTLDYLREKFLVPVPAHFLESLSEIPKTRLEVMNFANISRAEKPWNMRRFLQEAAFQYSTLRSSTDVKPRDLMFFKYLSRFLTFEKISKKLSGADKDNCK